MIRVNINQNQQSISTFMKMSMEQTEAFVQMQRTACCVFAAIIHQISHFNLSCVYCILKMGCLLLILAVKQENVIIVINLKYIVVGYLNGYKDSLFLMTDVTFRISCIPRRSSQGDSLMLKILSTFLMIFFLTTTWLNVILNFEYEPS